MLTTILTGFFGLFIPIIYFLLGFILGIESIILGIGGLLGNLVNIYNTNRYIKTQGTATNAPFYGRIASLGYIIVFIATIILVYLFNIRFTNINYWYLIIFAILAWIVLRTVFKNKKRGSLNNFKNRIKSYRIIEKYDKNPKSAIYLYFNNGKEGWNKTIPGSFAAKDPKNDLTFAFFTKDEALNYAKYTFENAEYLEG